ncbi:hypothetical protein F66182_2484 [Fusarium sp. NRRL 66182]|nr:hypothetical protein F66182_2484 [Fusarium sp. NRRL 66182]
MPSVNTLIAALVAGFAIGAQAGPCRLHAPYGSVVQSQVTTTEYIQPTSAAQETTESVSSAIEAQDTTTILPTTTSESKTSVDTTTLSPSTTTSESEPTPDTTASSEPKTTLGTTTTTLSPTTTSSEPSATTSKATATASETSTPSCPPASELTCGETGLFTNSTGHLLRVTRDTELEQCQNECKDDADCAAVGITGANQCELYDASVSALVFEARDDWWYSVYDACCFKEQ